jgi:hypothetical protein
MSGDRRNAARSFPQETSGVAPGGLESYRYQHPDPREVVRRPVSEPSPFVKIRGQWYRTGDDGQRNTLVPIDDPTVSPAERAAQRAAYEDAFYMAENPLAGVGYAIATAGGASPEGRRTAMLVGGAANAALYAAAPLGARRAPVRPAPQSRSVDVGTRPAIRYGPVGDTGQASGASASFTKSMVSTGGKARRSVTPPGWLGNGREHGQDRSHTIPKQLGGTGRTLQELVTLFQRPNRVLMQAFENQVARRVKAGEVVDYWTRPLYGSRTSAPSAVAMSANGSRGPIRPVIVFNRKGPR